ncbi:MAG: hypothetical protein FWE20_02295 [Defluviitaleaceae bacterium]|nr:hypothetical protein [Defluviitaleaceae bacterium]
MAKETEAILRAVLFSIKRASTLGEAEAAVRAMCSKEDIDSVEQEIAKLKASQP